MSQANTKRKGFFNYNIFKIFFPLIFPLFLTGCFTEGLKSTASDSTSSATILEKPQLSIDKFSVDENNNRIATISGSCFKNGSVIKYYGDILVSGEILCSTQSNFSIDVQFSTNKDQFSIFVEQAATNNKNFTDKYFYVISTSPPDPDPIPTNCGTLAPGDSQNRVRYENPSVTAPAECTAETQIRTCSSDGELTDWFPNSYSHETCIVISNNPPIAVADEVSVNEDDSVTINVLANDFDPDGDLIQVVSVNLPQNGSATVLSDGRITYIPTSSYSGTDHFSYTISDGDLKSSAQVSVTVVEDTTSPPKPGSGNTKSADAFVESIGVVTHLNWSGTFWDTDYEKIAPLFGESGIRYMRTQASNLSVSRMADLYDKYGIRTNVLINPMNNGLLDASKIDSKLKMVKSLGFGPVTSIEGPNEYNKTKNDGNTEWVAQLRDFQKQLYDKKNADSALRDLPLLGPSIYRRIEVDFIAAGDFSDRADVANLHYYSGGLKPTVYTTSSEGVLPMENALNLASDMIPGAPLQITETGYNNISDSVDSPWSVPERTQAKYTLRLMVETFRRGVQRSYIYALVDNWIRPNRYYGLLRPDYSRKPAYYSIKNTIKILKDSGSEFVTGDLSFSLNGDTTDVVHEVVQKRDGRFYLMIWQDVDSMERFASPPKELNPPTKRLQVDVSKHGFSKANVYLPTGIDMADPNNGATPVKSQVAPSVITIDVPDHVMIVELIP